jgi:predicted AlkP superfamily phosphohydrolase/phosphomutase
MTADHSLLLFATPRFVERHWDALPNLRALRDQNYFARPRTTAPPQSPVAWSTFITGLDPDQHGIYDFVHRDPVTLQPFSSLSKTEEPRFVLPLGPYLLPLSSSHVSPLRHGTPFWRTLSDHGVPVIVQHIPANYPPEKAGKGLSGMGTPDLLGTLGTFTLFTDDPLETARSVPGGRIVKTSLENGRALLTLEGPPNPLRKELFIISDHGFTTFNRAVHLNTWLKDHGFAGKAYAIGLNGLYLNHKDPVALADLRAQLLAWRDPANGQRIVEVLIATHPAPVNANIAPDLIVGCAPGYRASWQTALGEAPASEIEDNNDDWLADHCINPDDVPGVLFSNRRIDARAPRLQDLTAAILKRFGLQPMGYQGRVF